MVYLESLNVVHMDLRADNVLVNEAGKVKIADFGLTQILGSGMNTGISKFSVTLTTLRIMFPIIFLVFSLRPISCKVDGTRNNVWPGYLYNQM